MAKVMKQKVFLTLVALAIAMMALGYLTMHYYPLAYGYATSQSLCNVGAKFDCDSVAVSTYATWLGVPVAAWGFSFNALLFILVLLSWLGLRGDSDLAWREPFWLSLVSVLTSVTMATISLVFLPAHCLFCLVGHSAALVAFLLLWSLQPVSPFKFLFSDLKMWFSERRSFLIWLALFPAGAFFIHLAMSESNSDAKFEALAASAIQDWETAPQVQWTATPSLAKGASPSEAVMVITEFADFRCGHCKSAAPSLAAFVKAHPDVRLIFYTYPLDGACNSKMERADGVSCRLAKAVVCAERQQLGWAVHDKLFEVQSTMQRMENEAATDAELKNQLPPLGVDWSQLETCMQDPSLGQMVTAQAEQGDRAGVRGTPTIFVQGKKLEMGQSIRVLNLTRARILKP